MPQPPFLTPSASLLTSTSLLPLPCSSLSRKLQPATEARRQPAEGKGLAGGLQAAGTRVLTEGLPLFSPFCRGSGPRARCRLAPGRWFPSPGPLHCRVFNATSRGSCCTRGRGSQPYAGGCRSARAGQNFFSLRSVVIPTNVAMLLRHSEEGDLLIYCKSVYFC